MATLPNLFLFAATVIFTNFEYAVADDVYGCIRSQQKLLETYGPAASIYYWFPRCLAGGYFENVQCDFRGCFCAYLDSGKRIPQTIENVFMEYMRENCPWIPEKEPDPCSAPPVDFPCKSKSRKFYYNSDTGDCVETTNGCLGFDSSKACKESCVVQRKDRCSFKLQHGRTCDRRKPGVRWYHDDKQESCRPFQHNGCGGNSNSYREKWICLKTCESSKNTGLVIQVGRTKYIVSLPDWLVTQKLYVPSVTNNLTVQQFKDIERYMVEIARFPVQEGEEADEEEKRRLAESEKYRPEHAPKNMTRKEICEKSSDTGPCKAFIPKWYFDKEQSKCIKFIYGGCLGNENRHDTATGCAAFCNAEIEPTEADRIDDLISSGGTIGGLPDKPRGGRNGARPRVLGIGPTTTTAKPREAVVGGEAEIEFVIGDEEEPAESGDGADEKVAQPE